MLCLLYGCSVVAALLPSSLHSCCCFVFPSTLSAALSVVSFLQMFTLLWGVRECWTLPPPGSRAFCNIYFFRDKPYAASHFSACLCASPPSNPLIFMAQLHHASAKKSVRPNTTKICAMIRSLYPPLSLIHSSDPVVCRFVSSPSSCECG